MQPAFVLQGISQKQREKERKRKKDTGTQALMEEGCFIEFCKSIYTVIQGSFFR